MTTLQRYKKSWYSQHGQEGILREIFQRLEIKSGWFVDVGAWDGKYLSNTYGLLRNGWHGVGIEGDKSKFAELQKTSEENGSRLVPINVYVEAQGEKGLDALLATTECPKDFDLLKIDIDSIDWWVWEGLKNYTPKVVMIEINAGIPPAVPFVQAKNNGDGGLTGASFASTVDLARTKGYSLVCHVGDLFFVQNDLVKKVQLSREELENPGMLFDSSVLQQRYVTPSSIWKVGQKKIRDRVQMLLRK